MADEGAKSDNGIAPSDHTPPNEASDADFYAAPTVEYDARNVADVKQVALIASFFSPGNGASIVHHPIVGIVENIALAILLVVVLVIAMAPLPSHSPRSGSRSSSHSISVRHESSNAPG